MLFAVNQRTGNYEIICLFVHICNIDNIEIWTCSVMLEQPNSKEARPSSRNIATRLLGRQFVPSIPVGKQTYWKSTKEDIF